MDEDESRPRYLLDSEERRLKGVVVVDDDDSRCWWRREQHINVIDGQAVGALLW
jgi:hypothetical protein